MKQETKDKIITIIIFIFVIVFTIAVIQLVSIGVDLLRKRLNLDIKQPTNGQE